MPQLIVPRSKVQIVPRDGEIEITLNINISIDGVVTAQATAAEAAGEKDEAAAPVVPDFGSGFKLNFGKSG